MNENTAEDLPDDLPEDALDEEARERAAEERQLDFDIAEVIRISTQCLEAGQALLREPANWQKGLYEVLQIARRYSKTPPAQATFPVGPPLEALREIGRIASTHLAEWYKEHQILFGPSQEGVAVEPVPEDAAPPDADDDPAEEDEPPEDEVWAVFYTINGGPQQQDSYEFDFREEAEAREIELHGLTRRLERIETSVCKTTRRP